MLGSRRSSRARRGLRPSNARGMVDGMATRKVTITLEETQLAAIRELVAAGKLESVSGFVQHAVAVSLADMAGWGAMLAQALEQSGGPLRAKERAWADSILRAKPKRKRKAA
jgi:Arc/MetJ-type ribon-helix-helix transcriptional regulator